MMRYLLLLLLFSSCASPLIKVKRHWDKIQEELLKHPELADSLRLVKHDTLRIESFKDRIVVVNDSSVWGGDFFKEVDTLAKEVIKAPGVALPVTRLQKRICPELVKDSTYHILAYNQTIKIWIPIHLKIRAQNGRIDLGILSEDLKMPDPQVVKVLEFKSVRPPFYKDHWFWTTLILVLLTLLLLRERRPKLTR